MTFDLYTAERLLSDEVVPGITPLADGVVADGLATICWDGRRNRLILVPRAARRYVPVGTDQSPKRARPARLAGGDLLLDFFSRGDAWKTVADRELLVAALEVARAARLEVRFAGRLADAVSLAILARRGIAARRADLAPVDSDAASLFADANRAGLGLPNSSQLTPGAA